MRTASFLTLCFLAATSAFAANRPETITYIDGNLAGIAPHAGGTLFFSDPSALTVRTGSHAIKVPYSSITKTDLGGTLSHSHDVPAYKVWDLPKRVFPRKTETKYLTVNFMNEAGEPRTMTLELAETSASKVLATIDSKRSPAADTAVASSITEKPVSADPEKRAATPAPTQTASTSAPASSVAASSAAASSVAPTTPAAPAPQKTATKGPGTSQADKTAYSKANSTDRDWWDNSLWKTARNADKWPQTGSVAAGGQE